MDNNELAALARDVAALAACCAIDRETDPRRALPVIPSTAGWRILPRLLRNAAPHLDATRQAFCLALAETIEKNKPSPQIAMGKAV